MEPTVDELTSIVNASGFLFQLGVQHSIDASNSKHKFEIEAWEHPWHWQDRSGFIDLILGRSSVRLVCECKRSRDANWIFLVENGHEKYDRARLRWLYHGSPGLQSGWHDFYLTTEAHESAFCVVRGHGENQQPMLERIAALLVDSVDGLAEEEAHIIARSSSGDGLRIYVPIIVTNAHLWICKYDPTTIDLSSGLVENAEYTTVPYVMFRKALSTIPTERPSQSDAAPYQQFRHWSNEQDRTVLVVNAASFVSILTAWRDAVIRDTGYMPWRNEQPTA